MPLPIERKIHEHMERNHLFFSTSVDFYLKWAPYATVFILNAAGLKTKSDWKRQVVIAVATDGIRYLITDNLKKIVQEHRPAPYMGNHSFPSGHTSSSFAGAEFMHRELKSSIPVLSCAGYVAGIVNAGIRIYKSKHWLKDVIAGAAIGVASASFAYFIVNNLWRRKNKKGKKTDPTLREEKMEAEVA